MSQLEADMIREIDRLRSYVSQLRRESDGLRRRRHELWRLVRDGVAQATWIRGHHGLDAWRRHAEAVLGTLAGESATAPEGANVVPDANARLEARNESGPSFDPRLDGEGGLESRVSDVEERANTQGGMVQGLIKRCETIETRLGRVEAALTAPGGLQERMAKIEGRPVAQLELGGIVDRLNDQGGALSSLRLELSNLVAQVRHMSARFLPCCSPPPGRDHALGCPKGPRPGPEDIPPPTCRCGADRHGRLYHDDTCPALPKAPAGGGAG